MTLWSLSSIRIAAMFPILWFWLELNLIRLLEGLRRCVGGNTRVTTYSWKIPSVSRLSSHLQRKISLCIRILNMLPTTSIQVLARGSAKMDMQIFGFATRRIYQIWAMYLASCSIRMKNIGRISNLMRNSWEDRPNISRPNNGRYLKLSSTTK